MTRPLPGRVPAFAMLAALSVGALACASTPARSTVGLDFNGLAEALRAGGATVVTGEPVRQPFFSVPGRILVVNAEDVQIFEYDDASAAQADAARVSQDGGSIGTTIISWMAPPHFFRRDRLNAIYVGSNASVLAALSSSLGPQFAGR